mmetsp:Transcript_46318/g.68333  ORF Transcript_46318/g.68333 Transcript_46318/m.68333 type:complete len:329 (+) Transcript_46318:140-1126(+)|eukprot:CAMPEP_0195510648 /NCGR_PEP_ID=MMETSP0794_2-20130614/3234_1 /TAXON_ID=515487 /ORGANISM="Stephanopyxis turris, Strain CCMP 815" /LENGTH=328 /DNA_ID=CAMNT_0040638111 /DNA_START=128 /DNA_END=1114 /DNA_ORIENTATION=-
MSRRSARKVNIEIVELTSDTIKFFVKGIDVSMANSIRRVCIGEVPTLAIENVSIERNDTVLQDEFICHRLGFIPLKSTDDVRLKRMNYRNNSCTCGMTCPRCEVEFRIEYEHNIKHKDETFLLTSRALQPNNPSIQPIHFSNSKDEEFAMEAERMMRPEVEDTQTGIRIVKIGRGQGFKATCQAIKGTGKQHAKWSPVAECVFRQEPVIELNKSRLAGMSVSEKKAFVSKSPTKLFEYVEATGEVRVVDKWRCEFSGECERWGVEEMHFPADDNVVKMSYKPGSFLFTLETNGQMPPEQVVISAFEVLDEKIELIRAAADERDAYALQ